MHFEDLEPCYYHPGPLDADAWAVPLRAVGWLEHPHEFEVGAVPVWFVSRIGQMLEQTRQHLPHYRFRGAYECSFCRAAGHHTGGGGWSQENLIVPGIHEVYAAPGWIIHYVSDHSYRPPIAFVEAVASCPDCGSEQYFEALRCANAGLEPPVRSFEQACLQTQLIFEKTLEFKRALGIPLMQAIRSQVIAAARMTWPEASFSDEAESIKLGDVVVTFDNLGRVLDIS